MIYKIFDKRTSGSGIKKENVLNMLNLFIWKYVKEFAEELLENLKKKWKLIFYRQYLESWFCWYAINTQI